MTSAAPSADGDRHGARVLQDPLANRGTAFTADERHQLGLDGLLPPTIETLELQAARAYNAFSTYDSDMGRHIYLRQLQDTNEVLFYRLLTEHISEMLPIVYTPTVGLACQRFSHIYRRARGLFLSYPKRDRLAQLLRNRPVADVDVIVVTDGERILGLGDQGVGGMGIPIGKLSLYCAIGGIHPARTLPIVLDVGTNNEDRLEDPEYLGWRHQRIGGSEFMEFVDLFVDAVRQELPGTLLQWEDFATPNARPILDRYRDTMLTFNDDVQGTAAVVVGALSGAVAAAGARWSDQRIAVLGAGSAAIGVCDMIHGQLVADGLSEAQARNRFWIVDIDGLLTEARGGLSPEQRVYAQPSGRVRPSGAGAPDLTDVVDQIKPTVLIGLSTAHGAFHERLVRGMAETVPRPIIFPLSNPTSRSEADPADLWHWTEGRALIATGSPYPPLRSDAGTPVPVAQSNNVFVFPALGLGAIAARATRVTDSMLQAAATALGGLAPVLQGPNRSLLPPVGELRASAVTVAIAVAQAAVTDGVAPAASEDELAARVRETQWTPRYS